MCTFAAKYVVIMLSKSFKVFGILILLMMPFFMQAQSSVEYNPNLVVHKPAQLDTLVNIQKEVLKEDPGLEGYRIQIFFEGGNRSYKKALEIKSSFILEYPDIPVYLTFEAPYYKLQVGDFERRIEAEILLKELKKTYPEAFLVKTKIQYPDLE